MAGKPEGQAEKPSRWGLCGGVEIWRDTSACPGCKPTASSSMWWCSRAPGSGYFPAFGSVEQLGVLEEGCVCAGEHPLLQGAATSACILPRSPLGPLGGCWWCISQLSPRTPSPSAVALGSARDFFHRSEEAELIEQYSPGQHRSILKFLVLVLFKLRILRHGTQHPLALEAFP